MEEVKVFGIYDTVNENWLCADVTNGGCSWYWGDHYAIFTQYSFATCMESVFTTDILDIENIYTGRYEAVNVVAGDIQFSDCINLLELV